MDQTIYKRGGVPGKEVTYINNRPEWQNMAISADSLNGVAGGTWTRFVELLQAPLSEPDMLWFAIPLIIATVMMALYFGRYRREELGWNTAFANAMVFIFVSIDIIRRMYESSMPYSWANIWGNPLYLMITVALSGFGVLSMLVIYYHLLPKQVAFRLFSNLPVNITIYVLMCVVYAGVTLDYFTALAGILLFIVAWIILKILQFMQGLSGRRHEEEENGGRKREEGKHESKSKGAKEEKAASGGGSKTHRKKE